MKKLHNIALSFFTIILSSGFLSAQTDPLEQFIYQTYWGQPVAFDSISIRMDSLNPMAVLETVSLNRDTDGKIDSMRIFDHLWGRDYMRYQNTSNGGKHQLTAFGFDFTSWIPYARYSFTYQQNRVSEISFDSYEPDSSTFREIFLYTISYNSNGQVSDIMLSLNFGNNMYIPYVNYNYYYSQGRLDSVLGFETFSNLVIAKKVLSYTNGRVSRLDEHEFTGASGGLDTIGYYTLTYDLSNQHFETNYWMYSQNDHEYMYAQSMGYYKSSGNNVDLPKISLLEFDVYPNPVIEKLSIQTERPLQHIQVFDMGGYLRKIIYNQNEIDLSELSQGTYILQVFDGEKMATAKIVKA